MLIQPVLGTETRGKLMLIQRVLAMETRGKLMVIQRVLSAESQAKLLSPGPAPARPGPCLPRVSAR